MLLIFISLIFITFLHKFYIQLRIDSICRDDALDKKKIKKSKKNIPDDIPIIWVNIIESWV